jgi:hypothetical protein
VTSTCDICEFTLDDAVAHFPHVELCDGDGCTCGVRVHPACCWRCRSGVGDHVDQTPEGDTKEHITVDTNDLTVIDLVGITNIADRLGVVRSAPGLWETRYDDFPRRWGTINGEGSRPGQGVWQWKDVEAWCRKTGRLPLEEGRIYDDNGYDVTDKVRRGRKSRT